MAYKVITKTDKTTEQVFKTFTEAKKYFDNEWEEWAEYFRIEKVSSVFIKIWYICKEQGSPSRLYAGCMYIKKITE